MLIDRGTAVATGTPAELKAAIGEQRVDVTPADPTSLPTLSRVLGERFDIEVDQEHRIVSIPAPGDAADLTVVAALVRDSGIAVEEIALRRPTLYDAFLALTGQGSTPRDDQHDRDREGAAA